MAPHIFKRQHIQHGGCCEPQSPTGLVSSKGWHITSLGHMEDSYPNWAAAWTKMGRMVQPPPARPQKRTRTTMRKIASPFCQHTKNVAYKALAGFTLVLLSSRWHTTAAATATLTVNSGLAASTIPGLS